MAVPPENSVLVCFAIGLRLFSLVPLSILLGCAHLLSCQDDLDFFQTFGQKYLESLVAADQVARFFVPDAVADDVNVIVLEEGRSIVGNIIDEDGENYTIGTGNGIICKSRLKNFMGSSG